MMRRLTIALTICGLIAGIFGTATLVRAADEAEAYIDTIENGSWQESPKYPKELTTLGDRVRHNVKIS